MSKLPDMLHRAPLALYVAAVLMFVVALFLTWSELANYAYAEPGNPVYRQVMLRGVYTAAYEAICLASSGAMIHVLLAIWARMPGGDK